MKEISQAILQLTNNLRETQFLSSSKIGAKTQTTSILREDKTRQTILT